MTVLIIGGTNQGKLDFAKRAFGLKDDEICNFEGKIDVSARCFYKIHSAVKKLVLNNEFDSCMFDKLQNICKGKIIISDDISCGIVPIEKKECEWREASGRLLCALAQSADKVIRIQCGIPQVLKGKL